MANDALDVARSLRDRLNLSSWAGSVTVEWRADGPTIVVHLMPKTNIRRDAIPSEFEGMPVIVDGAIWGTAHRI